MSLKCELGVVGCEVVCLSTLSRCLDPRYRRCVAIVFQSTYSKYCMTMAFITIGELMAFSLAMLRRPRFNLSKV